MKEALLDNTESDREFTESSGDLSAWYKWLASEKALKDSSAEAGVNLFSQKTSEMEFVTQQFIEYLRKAYLRDALGHWIKGISAMDPFWQEKYRKGMRSLLEKNLIPILNSQGEKMTLEEFQRVGHQPILEAIRCVKEWGFIQKEEAIQCYIQYSHALSRLTKNFIPPGYDPDRVRVRNRSVKYEVFIEFVQHLSERDALIAKLLYFGSPSLDEVVSLKKNAIIHDDSSIRFQEGRVVFPMHVMQDLLSYISEKKDAQELVFTNVRGAEVERAHLNHAFSRASEKIFAPIKITPGGLLKLENEPA